MATTIKLKRRATGGASGAPAALKTAEPAFNEVDRTLYLGFGNDGSGNATSVIPVGGDGGFVDKTSAQTVAGVKTFSSSPVIPTKGPGTNNTDAASTAFVAAAIAANPNTAAEIHAAASKATPVDADELGITDSGASFSLKMLTWANLKATLKTYFDGFYSTVAHTHTFVSLTSKPTTLAGFGITDAINTSEKGAVNGIATLDGTGKVPLSQLSSAVTGALAYQNTWNATTNTPTIPAAAAGNKGQYYKVSVAGTTTIDTINDWGVGDWIVSNGTVWDKIDNTEAVSSVAGRTGAIVLANTDISGLGTMSTQNAASVAITGGTIDGVVLDGGTF